jgi:hypothetical protein
MSRVRDLASILTASSVLGTDVEVATAVSDHSAASDPHTGYVLESLIDAKGDLIVGSADNTVAKLTTGNNGEQIVADSSTSTGLRYQGNFAAGKNKIINGDFNINQRAFTSNTVDGSFNFDRWYQGNTGGTLTITPQTFTPGTAPVGGYEGKNYIQCVSASQTGTTYATLQHKIESVRTFAGQTVTLSFWAKATSGTPKVAFEWNQSFGTGGSPSGAVYGGRSNVTLSTSWARYSITTTIDSLTGKTIGTNNDDCLRLIIWLSASSEWNPNTGSIGPQNNTFQLWGIQLEAGSVATAFQTSTGTIQGELAACQRYFEQYDAASGQVFYSGYQQNSTTPRISLSVCPKRTTPTITYTGTLQVIVTGGSAYNVTSIDAIQSAANSNMLGFRANIAAGGTAGDACALYANGAVSLLYSSEL